MINKSIWKFPLAIVTRQTISLPEEAEILTVQVQDGMPTLWAMVDVGSIYEDKVIFIFGTGESFKTEAIKYIGTFQLNGVFHVFEDLSI